MLLYRLNLRISLEMFAVVSSFEIALRNAINKTMTANFGDDWLRDAVLPGGIFDVPSCTDHAQIIKFAYHKLIKQQRYTHTNLLAKMEFGVWKYMFASPQYRAANRILLQAFPGKPTSSRHFQYNNSFIFNELNHINSLRNRIAHHEPICFISGTDIVTTTYINLIYSKIIRLLSWLNIDSTQYLAEIENVNLMCEQLITRPYGTNRHHPQRRHP